LHHFEVPLEVQVLLAGGIALLLQGGALVLRQHHGLAVLPGLLLDLIAQLDDYGLGFDQIGAQFAALPGAEGIVGGTVQGGGTVVQAAIRRFLAQAALLGSCWYGFL